MILVELATTASTFTLKRPLLTGDQWVLDVGIPKEESLDNRAFLKAIRVCEAVWHNESRGGKLLPCHTLLHQYQMKCHLSIIDSKSSYVMGVTELMI